MFLEEIKPYRKDLEAYKKYKGIPNDKRRKAIFAIFDKYIKLKEYPQSQPTSLGCGACISNVMNRLSGLVTREETKINMEHITDSMPEAVAEVVKVITDEESANTLKSSILGMKWGALKTYAKSKGINTKAKKKVEILKELGVE